MAGCFGKGPARASWLTRTSSRLALLSRAFGLKRLLVPEANAREAALAVAARHRGAARCAMPSPRSRSPASRARSRMGLSIRRAKMRCSPMHAVFRLALVSALTGALLCAASDSSKTESRFPPAVEIVRKALDWVRWHEKQNFQRQWTLDHLNTTRHLNGADEIKSTERRFYHVYPLGGDSFYELVRLDGEPLTADEQRKQQKRKREFLEQAGKEASAANDDEDSSYVRFNDELINRYNAEVVGTEQRDGRTAYVIRFAPKSGKLPVKRRIDYALNKLRGKLWIDSNGFAVLGVEFELAEPVNVWAGLLGSVSELQGRIHLIELGGGAWYFKDMQLRLRGRMLFQSFHQERLLEWNNFRRIPESR